MRPPAGLATAAVYGVCRPAEQPRPLAPLLEAFGAAMAERAGRLLWNRLQPAAETLRPGSRGFARRLQTRIFWDME